MGTDSQTYAQLARWKATPPAKAEVLSHSYFNNNLDINAGCSFLIAVEEFVPKGATVIDMGCGSGYIAIKLYDMGYKTEGVDISEEMLAIFKQQAGTRDISYRLSDIFNMPIEKLYDAITIRYVFTHYQDYVSLLTAVARHVKQGGYLFFDSMTSESFDEYRKFSGRQDIGKSVKAHAPYPFSDADLRSSCTNLGLSVVCRRPVHFFYSNPFLYAMLESVDDYLEELRDQISKEEVFKFVRWFESSIHKHWPLDFCGHTMNVIRKVS